MAKTYRFCVRIPMVHEVEGLLAGEPSCVLLDPVSIRRRL